MASAVLGQGGEGRPDGLGAARPGEAGHMDVELHVVLRSLRREGTRMVYLGRGPAPHVDPVLSASRSALEPVVPTP